MTESKAGPSPRSWLVGLIFGFCWALFLSLFFSDIAWMSNAPLAPQPEFGKVCPHFEHGVTKYFTNLQALAQNFLMLPVPVALLSIFLIPDAWQQTKDGALGKGKISLAPADEKEMKKSLPFGIAAGVVVGGIVYLVCSPR